MSGQDRTNGKAAFGKRKQAKIDPDVRGNTVALTRAMILAVLFAFSGSPAVLILAPLLWLGTIGLGHGARSSLSRA